MPKTAKSPKSDKHTSLSLNVLNLKGVSSGKVSLSPEIFGAEENPTLLAQAVRVYLANQRQGTRSTKTRGEVVGSTKKIYRQKGTGRARHGSVKAPIFIGGGVAHGPKPKDFSLEFPKVMRRKALFSALSGKLKQERILAISGLESMKEKTKEMVSVLENLKLFMDMKKKDRKVMLIVPKIERNIQLSGRNIQGLTLRSANLLTTYEVLNHNTLVFSKDSFPALEKTFLKDRRLNQTKTGKVSSSAKETQVSMPRTKVTAKKKSVTKRKAKKVAKS